MADEFKVPSNPLILPTKVEMTKSRVAACGKCGQSDFGGRKTGGVLLYTCRACGHVWGGGRPQEPIDPLRPPPPEDPRDRPSISFEKDSKGNAVEIRRAVSLTQEFRKGAPVPPPGEEDV